MKSPASIAANQIGGQFRQPLIMILAEAIQNRQVFALHESGVLETWRNPRRPSAKAYGVVDPSNPIPVARRCAGAATGHAAAVLSSGPKNSRRLMLPPPGWSFHGRRWLAPAVIRRIMDSFGC